MKTWNPHRLRESVERKGLTRKFLAKECRIKVGSLNNIMQTTDPTPPSERLLSYLADLLGTNAAYLNFQSNDKKPTEGRVA